MSDKDAFDPSCGHPYIYGQIKNPETAAIYRTFQSIFPAFFFPVHLFKNPKYSEYSAGIDWDGLIYNASMGLELESVKEQLMNISKRYPEVIATSANLVRECDDRMLDKQTMFDAYQSFPIAAMLVGVRHCDVPMKNQLHTLKLANPGLRYIDHPKEQGFVNNFGYYRSRKEAYAVVKFHNQPLKGNLDFSTYDELYSEHLH